jgi:hypothetical protein
MTADRIPALLEPIQNRLNAATPGPWHLDRDEPGDVASVVAYASNDGVTIGTYVADTVEEDGDAAFIAAAPTDQARLLAAIRAVVAEIADTDLETNEAQQGDLADRILVAVEAALEGEA